MGTAIIIDGADFSDYYNRKLLKETSGVLTLVKGGYNVSTSTLTSNTYYNNRIRTIGSLYLPKGRTLNITNLGQLEICYNIYDGEFVVEQTNQAVSVGANRIGGTGGYNAVSEGSFVLTNNTNGEYFAFCFKKSDN